MCTFHSLVLPTATSLDTVNALATVYQGAVSDEVVVAA